MIIVEQTGWFGVPGRDGGQVHAVTGGRPVCGTKLHHESQFQYCAPGLRWDWLECERCKKMLVWQLHWKRVNDERWERTDGAAVLYGHGLIGPETDINLPGHRGWVALQPTAGRGAKHPYLGFFPRRWRRGGRSRMFVPIKFKTADNAIQALQKAFPWPKT